jgi:glutamate formiminotransferase/formiminotetrahydrofolate cyclodeaminase
MTQHSGEHPRFGGMDVCPLVPVANITMEETVGHARHLAKRLGTEAGLTVYCYEHAATSDARRNLADVRAGEYEGLQDKLSDPQWGPDFGPSTFQAQTGATAVSARDFLVAYNINLNTTSTRRANAIAFDVREKGRMKRDGDQLTGPVVRDEHGDPTWVPGTLKTVKAIGWFIDEYGVAQISMNLTNIGVTPVHIAFDEVCTKADARGVRVTGSELVGLIPLDAMLEAGRYFLRKQERSLGVSDAELIKIAVKSLGLDELAPFNPQEKIIEYRLRDATGTRLIDRTVLDFIEETASESPAPGGGSVAALLGALGAALATMVANLSSHKRGWDARWEEFSDAAVAGKRSHTLLTRLIDDDTDAFNRVMDAFRLPNATEAEQAARTAAIEDATKGATEVPLQVMEAAHDSMAVIRQMAETGLKSSVSDAGVAALCARGAVMGAHLNVRINLGGLKDTAYVEETLAKARALEKQAVNDEREILQIVAEKMES